MGELEKLTTLLHQEIRTTSYLLHPPTLDASGLSGALRWYVDGLRPRSGLDIELDIAKNLGRLPSDMELAVFRIVQEALTNVHRHSGSKKAVIRLSREEARVMVEIRDSGKGMSAEKLTEVQSHWSGVGLRGMRERVRQLHGEMRMESDGSGTRIFAVFPVTTQRGTRETGSMGATIH
jgi:signal transduction histidine kinase